MNRKNITLAIAIIFLLSGCIQVQFVEIQSHDEPNAATQKIKTPIPTETKTATPSQTITVTPSLTLGPKPTPTIQAIDDAPCYKGPGLDYPIISYLESGDEVLLIGISEERDWILIKETNFDNICWCQIRKLSIQSSDTTDLPEATAPPTSTLTPIPSVTPTRRPPTGTVNPYPPPYAPP
jgi:hypothetical protein